jgi:ABC-2 type transport system ATP-binding protein
MIYDASENGITIFVTTHYLDEAEYCDRICIMVDGKIEALDTPFYLKQNFKVDNITEVFYQLASKSNERR